MKRPFVPRALRCLICLLAVLVCVVVMPVHVYAADTPHVTQHTKTEIANHLTQSGTSISDPVAYAVDPVNYTEMGELSAATRQSALAELNNIRYIAGLDSVTLNDEYGRKAQAAAFADNAIGKLSHYPGNEGTKPDDMPDSLWQLGIEGAGKSNISQGQALNAAIRYGWMADKDSGNIVRMGHRSWCLNPEMSATGFGQVGRYAAMYSADAGNSSATQFNVVWPAQLMPVEYFSETYPWTIMTGNNISDSSGITVTITNKGTGVSWTLDSSNTVTPASDTSAYFGVYGNLNTGYAGQPGCIIFRPANFSFAPGDVFHVEATGVNGSTIEYDVEFFSGYPVQSMSFDETEKYLPNTTAVCPTIGPVDAAGYEITWTSSDESVVAVTGYPTYASLKPVNPGSATITATIAGSYTATGEPLTASFTAVVPKNMYNSTTMSINPESREYTGAPIRPTATIVDNETGETLVEGVDYTISMDDDITEPGERTTVWAWGLKRYENATGISTSVTKRSIREDMVTLNSTAFTYTGSVQKPAVSVAYGSMGLTAGTDYTLTNNGGTNVGTYQVTVRGAGSHFTSSYTASYTIDPATLDESMLTVGSLELTYTGKRQLPEVALSFNGQALSEGRDYELVTDAQSVDAGTYQLTVRGKGNFTGELTRSFTIAQASLGVKDDKQVEPVGSLTYGQTVSELTYANAAFVIEGTETAVSGTFAFDEPTAVLGAGTHEVAWTFTPDDTNCLPLKGSMSASVERATPHVNDLPTIASVAYRPTLVLGDVALDGGSASVPGTWVWDEPATALAVPGGTFACHFVPDDDANYRSVDAQLGVSVTKVCAYVVWPEELHLTYGERLADVELNGKPQLSETDATPVAGTLSWVESELCPTVRDSGVTEYDVRFVPEDEANYETLTLKVKLVVDKAAHPAVMPPATLSVKYSQATLENSLLAEYEDWEFEAAGTDLVAGETRTFTATYVGEDADCYEQTSAQVEVTRSTCDHELTEVRGAVEATCTHEGQTGDTYCLICNELIVASVTIPQKEHVWDDEHSHVTRAATCSTAGDLETPCKNCDTVKHEPTNLDPSNHENVVDEPLRPATLEADGEMPWSHCDACHKVLVERVTIPRVSEVRIDDEGLPWSGKVQAPSVTVSAGGNALVAGTDYTVEVDNDPNRGAHSATIAGKGNYSFTVTKPFTIVAREIVPTVKITPERITYDKNYLLPEVSVYDGSTKLVLGTDYDVELPCDTIEIGKYDVVVTLRGNYAGHAVAHYYIVKAPTEVHVDVTKNSLAMGKKRRVDAWVHDDAGELSFATSNAKVVKVSSTGVLTPVSVGTATVTVRSAENDRYAQGSASVKVIVTQGAQPMTVKVRAAKVSVKLAKVKKKAQTPAANVVVSKAKGAKSFANVSKGTAKKFKVNAKNGKVTIPKGTKKGTYAVKIKVTAKGDKNWKKGAKTVAYKVVVK